AASTLSLQSTPPICAYTTRSLILLLSLTQVPTTKNTPTFLTFGLNSMKFIPLRSSHTRHPKLAISVILMRLSYILTQKDGPLQHWITFMVWIASFGRPYV